MTKRALTQMTVAFLLGILGSCYRGGILFGLWACYLFGMFACLLFCQWRQRQEGKEPGKFWGVAVRTGAVLLFLLLGFGRREQHQAIIEGVETQLKEADRVRATGTVYKKEEKNETIIYYLKNSYLCGEDRIPCSRILVYLEADDYSIGDTIEMEGILIKFREARNEGNFNEKEYYYQKDLLFGVKAEEIILVRQGCFVLQEKLYQLRKQISRVYVLLLPEREAGVLGMMTLGEKGFLDTEVKKLYQQTGISHMLAISGLHVSILGMGIYRFLRKRRISYFWCGCIAGGTVWCFGFISGMELSTKRAVLMFLIMLLGEALGMAYDSISALSLAALLQLWGHPGSLWQAGFLFSYGAVLGVVAVARIWGEFWKGKEEKERSHKKKSVLGKGAGIWCDALAVSSCIQLVTLPLSAYFYYEFPVYGIFLNSLLLPFMGVILVSGLLGGVAGLFSFRAAYMLLKPAQLLLNWNAWVCGKFRDLPRAAWITGQPDKRGMVCYYLLLLLALYGMARWTKKRREPTLRQETASFWKHRLFCIVPVAALLFLLASAKYGRENQVCFLDVGQGDGVFFQAEGTAFFLDGGSTSESKVGEYRILSFLKCRGIGHIDGWFVSHGDQDHISGLYELWESGYQVDHLFLAKGMVRDEAWEQLQENAKTHQTAVHYLEPGDVVGTSSMKLTCLLPEEEGTDRNESSLVLRLEMKGKKGEPVGIRALFAGDIGEKQEQLLMERNPDLDVDLYKASHHGSNGSNSKALLEQLRPEVTVVSCGKRNRYGHPGKDAVERILSSNSQMFYTMDSGQVTVICKNGRIWIEPFLRG